MTKEEKVIIDKMREYYNIGRTYVGILNLWLKQIAVTFDIMNEEQNGFRLGEDSIFIVRILIEKYDRRKNWINRLFKKHMTV